MFLSTFVIVLELLKFSQIKRFELASSQERRKAYAYCALAEKQQAERLREYTADHAIHTWYQELQCSAVGSVVGRKSVIQKGAYRP